MLLEFASSRRRKNPPKQKLGRATLGSKMNAMVWATRQFCGTANLTMHMSMRRFTRLTNGFSRKVDNHAHMVAIHFMHYNFAKVHKTLWATQRWKRDSVTAFGQLRKSFFWQTNRIS
jgi:hypothetical protein